MGHEMSFIIMCFEGARIQAKNATSEVGKIYPPTLMLNALTIRNRSRGKGSRISLPFQTFLEIFRPQDGTFQVTSGVTKEV